MPHLYTYRNEPHWWPYGSLPVSESRLQSKGLFSNRKLDALRKVAIALGCLCKHFRSTNQNKVEGWNCIECFGVYDESCHCRLEASGAGPAEVQIDHPPHRK